MCGKIMFHAIKVESKVESWLFFYRSSCVSYVKKGISSHGLFCLAAIWSLSCVVRID